MRALARANEDSQTVLDWYDHNACTIASEFPSWNWESGTVGIICLKLTRVLAREASEDIVNQPFDGNLGLAVPGYVCVHPNIGSCGDDSPGGDHLGLKSAPKTIL